MASGKAQGHFGFTGPGVFRRGLLLVALVATLVAHGAPAAIAEHRVRVRLHDEGLVVDGQARVRVAAGCRPGAEVLEAFVTVSQDAAWGDAFFPLSCTGTVQRFVLTVESFDQPFVPGEAFGSAYVLIEGPGGSDQAQDSRTITLRESVGPT